MEYGKMSTSTDILSNRFVGSYRVVLLNNAVIPQPVLCENYIDTNTIAATRLKIFDGKVISNPISIARLDETFRINNAPIIIGPKPGFYDGLDFYFYTLNNLFPFPTQNVSLPCALPLMKSIGLTITDTNAAFNFELIGDGIREIDFSFLRQVYIDSVGYNLMDFDIDQQRPAYNSDFVVAFGPYRFFIDTFDYNFNLDMRYIVPMRQTLISLDDLNGTGDGNQLFTYQIPGKGMITVNGTATAQREVFGWTNYSPNGYDLLSTQQPGQLNVYKQLLLGYGNQFELFLQNGNNILPVFRNFISAGIRIDSGYFTSLTLTATQNEIKVAFNMELNASLIYGF